MNLKIALLQLDIAWEDAPTNFEKIKSYLKGFDSGVDLVILPEMFLTGFSMNVDKIALDMDCIYINELKKLAQLYNFAILGTLPVREKDKFFNRAIFFWPDGKTDIYDKRHLFRMGKEAEVYTHGESRVIIHYRGFKIMPLICYDLRFPVWSRNRDEYDLLIYMANWPKSRQKVWDVLLKARAIENYCYLAGVNRIGEGGGILYEGGSGVIDFKGSPLCEMDSKDIVKYVELNRHVLEHFKNKFPVNLDVDEFDIQ